MLFLGAMFGAALAHVLHEPPAPFAVVGMAAVFAGAAHVPIATLMMVTEMTGGYTLLVPAALAVMLSYLVQTRLVAGRKYRSLYEAQVPSRADSPAHHAEHLAIALRILKEHGPDVPGLNRSDLLPLLRLGLPVDLEGGRQLMIGVVRADTELADRILGSDEATLDDSTRVVAVLRGEHMMVPRSGTVLNAGDRLFLLTGAEAAHRLARQLDSW
jgi:CIC family chloride channel protein